MDFTVLISNTADQTASFEIAFESAEFFDLTLGQAKAVAKEARCHPSARCSWRRGER